VRIDRLFRTQGLHGPATSGFQAGRHFAQRTDFTGLVDEGVRADSQWEALTQLGERSEALMPRDPKGRAEVIEWIFAALNSVEMAGLPWSLFKFSGQSEKRFDDFLKLRLDRLEPVVAMSPWIACAGMEGADATRALRRLGRPRRPARFHEITVQPCAN
jgi:hypothetical protein